MDKDQINPEQEIEVEESLARRRGCRVKRVPKRLQDDYICLN